jgi:hypothetical protein
MDPFDSDIAPEPEPEPGPEPEPVIDEARYPRPVQRKALVEGGAVNAPLEGPATPFRPPRRR